MENLIFKLKSFWPLQAFTILVRYLLGIAFTWASIFKIFGIRFTPVSGEHAPIGSLAHLLESVYRTGFYWHFIGWAQLIAGFLIMSQTFSTLGSIAYFPLILSIFILTTKFESPAFWITTALMLSANVYLLLWDWNRLKFILLLRPDNYIDQTTPFSRHKIWTYIGVSLFIVIVILRIIAVGRIGV